MDQEQKDERENLILNNQINQVQILMSVYFMTDQ